MAENSSDPVAAWRTMLSEWEKGVNAVANKAMEKEDFAKMMGVVNGAGSAASGAFGDLMQRYLTTLNLPSRAELADVGARLQAIEGQLNQLTQMVRGIPGANTSSTDSAPKLARTRQPPKSAPVAADSVASSAPASPKGELL